MTYDLYIGDRTFSSWSLRGWLMFEKFGLPYTLHEVGLYTGSMADDMAGLAPARLVPAVRTPQGEVIGETLAIAETLAERHPEAGLWPKSPSLRIKARWLCAEMATGFSALRSACPMQLQHVKMGFEPDPQVLSDLARIEELWDCTGLSRPSGDWLLGTYSMADVFYAPVAARMIGYDLPVCDVAKAYCAQTINEPCFQAWRAAGLERTYDPAPYPNDLPNRPWPT